MKKLIFIVFTLSSFQYVYSAACVRINPIFLENESFDFICGDLYNLLIEKPYFYKINPRKIAFIGIKRNSSREGSTICSMLGRETRRAQVSLREIDDVGVVFNLENGVQNLAYGTNTVINDIICE
jgi:hypothetical protein